MQGLLLMETIQRVPIILDNAWPLQRLAPAILTVITGVAYKGVYTQVMKRTTDTPYEGSRDVYR
jgi:hypothetical protein